MDVVMNAARQNTLVPRKVGFVLVGCVVYKAPFEPPNSPTHQTRFIYYLGQVEPSGGFQPYVQPSGVADKLMLISTPDGYVAD